MTRAALAALIIATAAVAAGGKSDGTNSNGALYHRIRLSSRIHKLLMEEPLADARRAGGAHGGASAFSLRIPFLARDGVADSVAVAQPTAVIAQVSEPQKGAVAELYRLLNREVG